MGHAPTKPTLQEFIDWEEQQAERHEFHRGEVFAMVGARRVHNEVSGNVYASLKRQLRGSPCRAFIESMKLKMDEQTVLYPDVFVTCDPADLRTQSIFTSPTLVVEVLSPSTESYDRGSKFGFYRSLPSLREYMLIEPPTREVQLFRRGADSLFTLHDLTGREHIKLASIECELLAADVFDGVEPEPGQQLGLPV